MAYWDCLNEYGNEIGKMQEVFFFNNQKGISLWSPAMENNMSFIYLVWNIEDFLLDCISGTQCQCLFHRADKEPYFSLHG